jgi:hypothetical protein
MQAVCIAYYRGEGMRACGGLLEDSVKVGQRCDFSL